MRGRATRRNVYTIGNPTLQTKTQRRKHSIESRVTVELLQQQMIKDYAENLKKHPLPKLPKTKPRQYSEGFIRRMNEPLYLRENTPEAEAEYNLQHNQMIQNLMNK